MKYDAVIFDLFGTLVDVASKEAYRSWHHGLAAVLGVPGDAFHAAWVEAWRARYVGELATIEACLEHACRAAGRAPDQKAVRKAARLRLEGVRRWLTPRPGAVEVLGRVRRSGLKTGLISDCDVGIARVWPRTPLAPLVDAAVFSCIAHLRKPDPRIYHQACERLGVQPGRCLYVGDGGRRELSGAARVGMEAVLIRVPYEDSDTVHRVEGEEWTGRRISSLQEVLGLIG